MFSPTGWRQTVAVVDQSGKVVSSGKQLRWLLDDARDAYRARKAEIAASKRPGADRRPSMPTRCAYTIDDNGSCYASPHNGQNRSSNQPSSSSRRASRPHDQSRRRHSSQYCPAMLDTRLVPTSYSTPVSPISPGGAYGGYSPRQPYENPPQLPRRSTAADIPRLPPRPPTHPGMAMDEPDMDLAYGEYTPEEAMAQGNNDAAMKGLVGRASFLLEEADCLKHSARATIASLSRNPDAMAAIGLTLAEISALVKKVSPSTLLILKRAAPAVFSLLASPQFLIAAGVGVGVTIIAFGGYKIIRKIQAKNASSPAIEPAMALPAEIGHIDSWRRGIADVEAESVGTSVDGELISPEAERLSRLYANDPPQQSSPTGATAVRLREPVPPRSRTAQTGSGHSSRRSKSVDGRSRRPPAGPPSREQRPSKSGLLSPLKNFLMQ